jgi:hypothetical protein
LIDLAATGHRVWENFFWTALQTVLIDPVSLSVKASTRTYQRNAVDYREAHIARALSVLSLYETTKNATPVLSARELHEIQSRLLLSEKPLGGIVDDVQLPRVYGKHVADTNDVRGHNWELLRQRAEAEALYFEPLELPDGSATCLDLCFTRRHGAKCRASFRQTFSEHRNSLARPTLALVE